jgi:hypothetical protein
MRHYTHVLGIKPSTAMRRRVKESVWYVEGEFSEVGLPLYGVLRSSA